MDIVRFDKQNYCMLKVKLFHKEFNQKKKKVEYIGRFSWQIAKFKHF